MLFNYLPLLDVIATYFSVSHKNMKEYHQALRKITTAARSENFLKFGIKIRMIAFLDKLLDEL